MSEREEVQRLSDGREVTLRPSVASDALLLHAYINELGHSTDMILSYEDDPMPIERIESNLELLGKGRMYSLVAIEPEAGGVVGNISFRFGVRKKLAHTAEMGMGVLPSYQGVGLGTALLERAVEDMRAHPTIERLDLTVIVRNGVARQMYKRVGFVEEGVKVRGLKQPDGSYDDEMMMAMWVGCD